MITRLVCALLLVAACDSHSDSSDGGRDAPERCPTSLRPGDACSHSLVCDYGTELCCGSSRPSTQCTCDGERWVCGPAEPCPCDAGVDAPSMECPDGPYGIIDRVPCIGDAYCEYGDEFGSECCCGECFPSSYCRCDGAFWQCGPTDACLAVTCDGGI